MPQNDVSIYVSIDAAKIQADISKISNYLDSFGRKIQASLLSAFTIDRAIQKVTSGVMDAVQSMAAFERKMSEIKAVTGATGEEFKKLSENALNMGGAFKAADIAQMELELGRLGFTTQEIVNTTKTATNLALVSGENLGRSADILGSTLRAFNLSTSEAGRVGDVMASAFNKSALSLESFGEAIKYVAPVAAAAGFEIEEVAAHLGVLADNGIRGSMAGTSLRKIYTDMGQGAAPLFNQKLREMAAAGSSASQAFDEVGRTAYTSLLILSKNTGKIDEAIRAHHNLNGELQKQSEIIQNNLQGDWDKLNASIDKGLNQNGGAIISIIRAFSQATDDAVKALTGQQTINDDTKGNWFLNALGIFPDQELKSESDFFKQYEEKAQGFRASMKAIFNRPSSSAAPDPYSHEAALAASSGKIYDNMFGLPQTNIGKDLSDLIKVSVPDIKALIGTFPGIDKTIQSIQNTMNSFDMKPFIKKVRGGLKDLSDAAVDISSILKQALAEGIIGVADALNNAFAGVENFGTGLVKAIARVADNLGNMLIATGVAMLAFDKVIEDPLMAIGAGLALKLAAGAAMRSVVSSAASGGMGAGSSQRIGDLRLQPQPVNITGQFTIKGPDLVAAINKQGYVTTKTG